MCTNLFNLPYSDALKYEIENIKDPKVRTVFIIYFREMEKAIERNPEDSILTFREFLSAKIIS